MKTGISHIAKYTLEYCCCGLKYINSGTDLFVCVGARSHANVLVRLVVGHGPLSLVSERRVDVSPAAFTLTSSQAGRPRPRPHTCVVKLSGGGKGRRRLLNTSKGLHGSVFVGKHFSKLGHLSHVPEE